MRVISGLKRGLKLSAPQNENTRPTLDRVKEAVFSMLMPVLFDSTVLDLFAGSGALGIEALSRGSKKAVFIDSSNDAIKCIKKNLEAAQMTDISEVYKCCASEYLNLCDRSFDIIFMDPPYSDSLYNESLQLIASKDILAPDGCVITEWDKSCGKLEFPDTFFVEKERKYGRVCITVLKRR